MLKEFTKDTTLTQVLEMDKGEEILTRHNIPCLSCPFAEQEMKRLTLGQICAMYNLDLKALLKELNDLS